jgi:hypothetical protein
MIEVSLSVAAIVVNDSMHLLLFMLYIVTVAPLIFTGETSAMFRLISLYKSQTPAAVENVG